MPAQPCTGCGQSIAVHMVLQQIWCADCIAPAPAQRPEATPWVRVHCAQCGKGFDVFEGHGTREFCSARCRRAGDEESAPEPRESRGLLVTTPPKHWLEAQTIMPCPRLDLACLEWATFADLAGTAIDHTTCPVLGPSWRILKEGLPHDTL